MKEKLRHILGLIEEEEQIYKYYDGDLDIFDALARRDQEIAELMGIDPVIKSILDSWALYVITYHPDEEDTERVLDFLVEGIQKIESKFSSEGDIRKFHSKNKEE